MPVIYETLNIDQGADYEIDFIWTVAGVPQAMAGATARCMIRVAPSDAVPIVSVTTTPSANGSLLLGASDGTVVLKFSKIATALLTVTSYQFDLYIDFSNGVTITLAAGLVNVRLSITH